MVNLMFDDIYDMLNEGILSINSEGIIGRCNKKAKEIFGIINVDYVGHESGRVEEGDIVIIGDTSLGEDDGGLLNEDLKLIGIKDSDMKFGTPFIAIGKLGDSKGGTLRFKDKFDNEGRFCYEQSRYGHKISCSMDFISKTVCISVDNESYECKYIKCIGHIVVICGKTGNVKFYQSAGYTSRREDLKKILCGSYYKSKGDYNLDTKIEGRNIFELYPAETNSHIVEFFDAANNRAPEYSKKLKIINGIPTRCSLKKYFDGEEVKGAILIIEDITELQNVMIEKEYFQEALNSASLSILKNITWKSESMEKVVKHAIKASKTNSTVLILGESGTGKSMLAECIHKDSTRKNGPFICVNCAAIPQSLIESELFGYERGSFTGANKEGKKGLIESADGGTLFLDEIGDMPLFVQVKLLNVIQTKKIMRIGSTEEKSLDIRIITATNKNLEGLVENKEFREDLYYRINVFPIHIPPIRERREDIIPLIYNILPKIFSRMSERTKKLSDDALRVLINYDWFGNVRELENVLERAVNLCEGEEISIENIFINYKNEGIKETKIKKVYSLQEAVDHAEKKAIADALLYCDGNKAEAQKMLKMGKTSFYEKMKKHNIKI